MDKLLVLVVFFALHGLAPGYIQDLVMPNSPNRNRRDDQRLFVVPRFTLEGFGRRAFSVSGATLRNSLPEHFLWQLFIRSNDNCLISQNTPFHNCTAELILQLIVAYLRSTWKSISISENIDSFNRSNPLMLICVI